MDYFIKQARALAAEKKAFGTSTNAAAIEDRRIIGIHEWAKRKFQPGSRITPRDVGRAELAALKNPDGTRAKSVEIAELFKELAKVKPQDYGVELKGKKAVLVVK